MLNRSTMAYFVLLLTLLTVSQFEIAVCDNSEVEAATLKPKSGGFFSGFKSLFRGSSETTTAAPTTTTTTTTTTQKPVSNAAVPLPPSSSPSSSANRQRPPPFTLQPAPLMPLGPRPETPLDSPQRSPIFEVTTKANAKLPDTVPNFNRQGGNLPPGFNPVPKRQQPSPFDLSYGSVSQGGQNVNYPGISPVLTISTTTSTTTTKKPVQIKEDFPALPPPRTPTKEKEFFPPVPAKQPSVSPALPSASPSLPSVSPPSPPSSPTAENAWNKPLTPPTNPISNRPTPSSGSIGARTTTPSASESSDSKLANDDEIRALTETMYNKEVNNQIQLIQVSPQGKTRSIDSTDEAPQPLLQIDEKAFESPTIAALRLLFNNYESDTLVNEHVTPNERKEENDFIDAVLTTAVMRQAMQFLQSKGIVSPDPKSHRDLLKELWFTQYSRGMGKIGSSGFEHVFVSEVKENTIIGLHNWVYFYEEEKAGRLDYKGFIKQLDIGSKGKVLKARFTHKGLNKPVNTLFIGTSPELELALYTVCFKVRPDRTCPVSLNNNKFGIVTYTWRYRGKNLIGSAYPEI